MSAAYRHPTGPRRPNPGFTWRVERIERLRYRCAINGRESPFYVEYREPHQRGGKENERYVVYGRDVLGAAQAITRYKGYANLTEARNVVMDKTQAYFKALDAGEPHEPNRHAVADRKRAADARRAFQNGRPA